MQEWPSRQGPRTGFRDGPPGSLRFASHARTPPSRISRDLSNLVKEATGPCTKHSGSKG